MLRNSKFEESIERVDLINRCFKRAIGYGVLEETIASHRVIKNTFVNSLSNYNQMRIAAEITNPLKEVLERIDFQGIDKVRNTFIQMQPHILEFSRTMSAISETLSPRLIQMAQVSYEMVQAMSPYLAQYNEMATKLGVVLSKTIGRISYSNLTGFEYVLSEFSSLYSENFDDIKEEEFVEQIANFTEQQVSAIAETVEMVVLQPKNWQTTLAERIAEWKIKNPAISWLIQKIIDTIYLIITGVVVVLIAQTITDTRLRSNPEVNAEVIATIQAGQAVEILDEVPYWFEVEYTDIGTSEQRLGWMPKRCVRRINNNTISREDKTYDESETGINMDWQGGTDKPRTTDID